MSSVTATDGFDDRCRASFGRQKLMETIGARLESIQRGEVAIELPYRADLGQQHGYLHAGILAAIADSACGYAALTLMRPGAEVLTVEFKINLLKPASAALFRAVGKVIRAGQTLTVCSGEVWAGRRNEAVMVAAMQATMIARDCPADSGSSA